MNKKLLLLTTLITAQVAMPSMVYRAGDVLAQITPSEKTQKVMTLGGYAAVVAGILFNGWQMQKLKNQAADQDRQLAKMTEESNQLKNQVQTAETRLD